VKVDANQSNNWTTKYENEAEINLAHSTAALFSFKDILDLNGGPEAFISQIEDEKLSYSSKKGFYILRDKVASIYNEFISYESILITNGCNNANFLAYYTFLEPADEIIIIIPTWWPIMSVPSSFGCKVKFLFSKPEDAFIPDLDELAELITQKTKMIVITNPNNPSGAFMDASTLHDLISIAEKTGIWILCDEIYKGIESNSSICIPAIAELYEKGLTTNSVSKTFGIPGIRIGWIAGSKFAIKQIRKRWDYIVGDYGFLDQRVAEIALDCYSHIMGLQRGIAIKNRKILRNWVENEPMIECPVLPVSGTTAFLKCQKDIDTRDFTVNLIKKTGTYVVPGAVYDKDGRFNNYFRIGYMNNSNELEKGLENITSFLKSI